MSAVKHLHRPREKAKSGCYWISSGTCNRKSSCPSKQIFLPSKILLALKRLAGRLRHGAYCWRSNCKARGWRYVCKSRCFVNANWAFLKCSGQKQWYTRHPGLHMKRFNQIGLKQPAWQFVNYIEIRPPGHHYQYPYYLRTETSSWNWTHQFSKWLYDCTLQGRVTQFDWNSFRSHAKNAWFALSRKVRATITVYYPIQNLPLASLPILISSVRHHQCNSNNYKWKEHRCAFVIW